MAKTYFLRLALLGCVSGAVLGLGACSSGPSGFSAGRTLGALAEASEAGTGSGSSSSSASGGAGTGTTGTTTTTGATTTASTGTASNSVDTGGGGSNSMNGGGSTAPSANTGALARVSDLTGDLTGGLITVAGNAVLSPMQVIQHHNDTLTHISSFGPRVTAVTTEDLRIGA